MAFYDQLEKLCRAEGVTPTSVVLEAGMSKGTMSNWKKGAMPNGEAVVRFSERFGVSTDFLLLGKDTVDTISSEEQEFLDLIRKLPQEKRWELKGYIKRMAEESVAAESSDEIPPEVAAK